MKGEVRGNFEAKNVEVQPFNLWLTNLFPRSRIEQFAKSTNAHVPVLYHELQYLFTLMLSLLDFPFHLR